jgi:hypothetical protein
MSGSESDKRGKRRRGPRAGEWRLQTSQGHSFRFFPSCYPTEVQSPRILAGTYPETPASELEEQDLDRKSASVDRQISVCDACLI